VNDTNSDITPSNTDEATPNGEAKRRTRRSSPSKLAGDIMDIFGAEDRAEQVRREKAKQATADVTALVLSMMDVLPPNVSEGVQAAAKSNNFDVIAALIPELDSLRYDTTAFSRDKYTVMDAVRTYSDLQKAKRDAPPAS
jgi:hypothetical protein